jgi:Protein of unknown function (DUF2997)
VARRKIKIRIAKNGDTTVETLGFKGPSCKEVTKQLEAALGTVTSSKNTKEMFERERPYRKRRQPDGTWKRIYLD